jgi:hypothetical protein
VFDVLERFGAELAMFAALALNCASGTGDFMFVPYLRPTMRCTALHFLALFFLPHPCFYSSIGAMRHMHSNGVSILPSHSL